MQGRRSCRFSHDLEFTNTLTLTVFANDSYLAVLSLKDRPQTTVQNKINSVAFISLVINYLSCADLHPFQREINVEQQTGQQSCQPLC